MPSLGYTPIACGFHDLLLHFATLRSEVEVIWVEGNSQKAELGAIVDVFASQGAEFLRLGSGTIIRLDKLVSVDGNRLEGGAFCQV